VSGSGLKPATRTEAEGYNDHLATSLDEAASNEAAEYARQMLMPKGTVLAYFRAHGIETLKDIRAAFPRAGHVAQDMQAAITAWVLA
jgi:hypothetical protein